ncbi:hypothetical protein HID58_019578, partial [Brassica napus]
QLCPLKDMYLPKDYYTGSVSPQDRRYEKERSYSRSPPKNYSSGSHGRVRSRSPRSVSVSQGRSVSPRRTQELYTPEQARRPVARQRRSRSRSLSPRGERNGDRSPSQ